jgi:hypothetical protein
MGSAAKTEIARSGEQRLGDHDFARFLEELE